MRGRGGREEGRIKEGRQVKGIGVDGTVRGGEGRYSEGHRTHWIYPLRQYLIPPLPRLPPSINSSSPLLFPASPPSLLSPVSSSSPSPPLRTCCAIFSVASLFFAASPAAITCVPKVRRLHPTLKRGVGKMKDRGIGGEMKGTEGGRRDEGNGRRGGDE